jgi:hypothetical protein
VCEDTSRAAGCARFCHEIQWHFLFSGTNGEEMYFRRALWMKCHREFEAVISYGGSRSEKLVDAQKADTVRTLKCAIYVLGSQAQLTFVRVLDLRALLLFKLQLLFDYRKRGRSFCWTWERRDGR